MMQSDLLQTQNLLLWFVIGGCGLKLMHEWLHYILTSWNILFWSLLSRFSFSIAVTILWTHLAVGVSTEAEDIADSIRGCWESFNRHTTVATVIEELSLGELVLVPARWRVAVWEDSQLMNLLLGHLQEVRHLLHRTWVLISERLLLATIAWKDTLVRMLVFNALMHHAKVLLIRVWIVYFRRIIWCAYQACAVSREIILLIFQNRRQVGILVSGWVRLLRW